MKRMIRCFFQAIIALVLIVSSLTACASDPAKPRVAARLDEEGYLYYMDYVKEIGKNPLARKVKLADLTHNMDISRIPDPTQKDYNRIEKKYKPAYECLKGL